MFLLSALRRKPIVLYQPNPDPCADLRIQLAVAQDALTREKKLRLALEAELEIAEREKRAAMKLADAQGEETEQARQALADLLDRLNRHTPQT